MKRTPLRRAKGLRRQSRKTSAAYRERRKMLAAMTADGPPVCVVPWCGRAADDAHEPLTRARGGSISDPDNVVPICRPCHNEITDTEPTWAYELGLLVHSWEVS